MPKPGPVSDGVTGSESNNAGAAVACMPVAAAAPLAIATVATGALGTTSPSARCTSCKVR